MINESSTVSPEVPVIEGIQIDGRINTSDEVLLSNIRSSIRRGYPQIRPQVPNYDRIALVGSGPSLIDTEKELVDLIRGGAKLVTMNGAYKWCIDRNLTPHTQIVMDARASNARFLEPALPQCRYVLASQCAPETWDAVEDREHVWVFHAAAGQDDPLKALLDEFYLGQWFGVGGGMTVATRAISLLRTVGYVRFDLFGIDSCWMHGEHHAFDQPENSNDKCIKITVWPLDRPEAKRRFVCSPWHVKQFEDFLQVIRVNGEHFLLNVHGNGLLAYALEASADIEWSKE